MVRILNLTQHPASPDQVEAGVFEPKNKDAVKAALTFKTLPDRDDLTSSAVALTEVAEAEGATVVMIGGAPFFMKPLEDCLAMNGIHTVYAFSVRESQEVSDGNGGVRKVSVFRHLGFVG